MGDKNGKLVRPHSFASTGFENHDVYDTSKFPQPAQPRHYSHAQMDSYGTQSFSPSAAPSINILNESVDSYLNDLLPLQAAATSVSPGAPMPLRDTSPNQRGASPEHSETTTTVESFNSTNHNSDGSPVETVEIHHHHHHHHYYKGQEAGPGGSSSGGGSGGSGPSVGGGLSGVSPGSGKKPAGTHLKAAGPEGPLQGLTHLRSVLDLAIFPASDMQDVMRKCLEEEMCPVCLKYQVESKSEVVTLRCRRLVNAFFLSTFLVFLIRW
jgi:hypothetical protein